MDGVFQAHLLEQDAAKKCFALHITGPCLSRKDQLHHEPNREKSNYKTEQGCNVGLAVTCVFSGPLSKIQVPKIKVAAFPGSFSSSSDQAEDCMWMGRQFWQQRSDWDCKRQRPAQSCLGLLIIALYSMVEP